MRKAEAMQGFRVSARVVFAKRGDGLGFRISFRDWTCLKALLIKRGFKPDSVMFKKEDTSESVAVTYLLFKIWKTCC